MCMARSRAHLTEPMAELFKFSELTNVDTAIKRGSMPAAASLLRSHLSPARSCLETCADAQTGANNSASCHHARG